MIQHKCYYMKVRYIILQSNSKRMLKYLIFKYKMKKEEIFP